MTSEYDVLFPKAGRLKFDGGLNSKFERSLIQDNESPDCLNVGFVNGAVSTRGGTTKLNTTAIGSFVLDGLYTRRENNGAETMVAFAGGTAWQLGVTTFTTIASAQSVFTAGVRVATAQYENHMFVGNGYVTPYKYNGVAWTRHGVTAPSTSGTTGAVSGGGSLAASTYFYKISNVNSASAESDVSTATTGFVISTASGAVNLTALPVAPQSHGVGTRRLYRATAVAGSYLRIATISDNTTTTYSDVGAAASTAAPTDNGMPPAYSTVVYHQNRLFVNDAANPNYLWYSELFEPYTFPSTNFLPIGDGSFDLIKGLAVYDDAVAVICEASVTLLYMSTTDPADWRPVRTRSPFGSRSPFGTFLYGNKLAFAAQQNGKFVGYAALHGTAIDIEATVIDQAVAGSETISERIEPDMFDVVESKLGNISAIVFKNRAYITVTSASGNTTNNRVYCFDFSKTNLQKQQDFAWSPITGVNASQFTVYAGNLYYGVADPTGFIYQMETGTYVDQAAAINSYYWTKEYSGNKGHENYEKDFRWLRILVEKLGAYYMGVSFRTDSDAGGGFSDQINLDPGSTLWNAFTWGGATWGGGVDQEEVTIPLGLSGKRIQVMFSNQNTAGRGFKVHAMNLNYNIKGKR